MALSTAPNSGGALVKPQYGAKPSPAKPAKAPRSSPQMKQPKGK